MMDHRTKRQIAADDLDQEIHRLCQRLDCFATYFKNKDISGMATSIDAMRHRVREHMHAEDRERTAFNIGEGTE